MTATDTAIAAAATWQTALAAVDAATGAAKDDALTDLMEVETRIEAEPVQDLPGATLRLRLALVMAGRQGVDDDPAWVAVSDALAILECAATSAH